MRLAIATPLCHCTDEQLGQASQLKASLDTLVGSSLRLDAVALTHDCLKSALLHLMVAGWRVHRVNTLARFAPLTKNQPGFFWPRREPRARTKSNFSFVQQPPADGGACSALKLHAWQLHESYDRVLLVDAARLFCENPYPWLRFYGPSYHFAAAHANLSAVFTSRGRRPILGGDGLETSIILLHPSTQVFRLLSDKAATASYLPRTNTIGDVLETAFAIHGDYPPMPHTRTANTTCGDRSSRMDPIVRASRAAPDRTRRNADDTREEEANIIEQAADDDEGSRPTDRRRPRRFAFATAVCNATDTYGAEGGVQIERAVRLLESLRATGSTIDAVALSNGYDAHAQAVLTTAGWIVHAVPAHAMVTMQSVRKAPGYHWPRFSRVQNRTDMQCTALKLVAWTLTKYDRILLSDTDVCILQDPGPWLSVHQRLGHYFASTSENSLGRGYQGLNSHLVLVQPEQAVFEMLAAMASTASYIPHTMTEQDVLETIFNASPNVSFVALPEHIHGVKRVTYITPRRGVLNGSLLPKGSCPRSRFMVDRARLNEVRLSPEDAERLNALGGPPNGTIISVQDALHTRFLQQWGVLHCEPSGESACNHEPPAPLGWPGRRLAHTPTSPQRSPRIPQPLCGDWQAKRVPRASSEHFVNAHLLGTVRDDWGQIYRVRVLHDACVSAGKWWSLPFGNWSLAAFERGAVYDATSIYDSSSGGGTQWTAQLPREPLHVEAHDSLGTTLQPFDHEYYHSIIEVLPKLLALLAVDTAPMRILVPDGRIVDALLNEVFLHESNGMRRRGYTTGANLVRVRPGWHYYARTLYVPPPARRDRPGAGTLGMLRSHVGATLHGSAGTMRPLLSPLPTVLVVSRASSSRRRWLNENSAVVALSRALNGTAVVRVFEGTNGRSERGTHLIGLHEAFRSARVVVGPHGAGLTGIAFSRPGTHVIEVGAGCCYEHMSQMLALKHTRMMPELSRESAVLTVEPQMLILAVIQALSDARLEHSET